MADLILSKDEKVLLDFSELLKKFIFKYGEIESKFINGELKTTMTIPKGWVNLIESVSKSKYHLTGCIKVCNSESFNILRDFLLEYDNIANDEICCESINCLESKLDKLCDDGIINIDKSETYSIASEIVSCYFYPIVSFGEEYLYYANGDIEEIAYLLSNELDISLSKITILPSIFLQKIMRIKEKYRLLSFFEIPIADLHS